MKDCKCKFKIRVNRRWIEDTGAAFKKEWLTRFNRVYFGSVDADGKPNEEVIPNYNIYYKPTPGDKSIQVRVSTRHSMT